MSPEYGATIGYFPVDETTIQYLLQTGFNTVVIERTEWHCIGRDAGRVRVIEQYLRAQGLFNEPGTVLTYILCCNANLHSVNQCSLLWLNLIWALYNHVLLAPSVHMIVYYFPVWPKISKLYVQEFTLSLIWFQCLTNKVGFKGFGLASDELSKTVSFDFHGKQYQITHGSVVIAAITSCTNTSNPNVMIAAGLLCRNARAKGLKIQPYIKTSLSPGYVIPHMHLLTVWTVAEWWHAISMRAVWQTIWMQWVTTFVAMAAWLALVCHQIDMNILIDTGNSGELPDEVKQVLTDNPDVVAAAVLSGIIQIPS